MNPGNTGAGSVRNLNPKVTASRNMEIWVYSLTYRALVRFDSARIAPNQNVLDSYKSWPKLIPFGKRLEPWYQRNIEPWFSSRIGD